MACASCGGPRVRKRFAFGRNVDRLVRSGILGVLIGMAGSVAGVRPALAEPAGVPEIQSSAGIFEAAISLDIAAQPLEEALYAFGAATGIEVLADGGMVTGRRSAEVKGTFTATQALRVLLTGTGLAAHPIGTRAITLSPIADAQSGSAIYRNYSATLQNAALRQLCAEREAGFGTYRIAMQVWINEIGSVKRVALLSSTGDRARDSRIIERLAGMTISAPPRALPQPVVMVILPRSPQQSGDCTVRDVRSHPPGADSEH
jgi:hypothetical protein